MADVDLRRLQELLAQLDEVCRQARDLQRTVRETLAESRRRDRFDRLDLGGQPAPERRKRTRQK